MIFISINIMYNIIPIPIHIIGKDIIVFPFSRPNCLNLFVSLQYINSGFNNNTKTIIIIYIIIVLHNGVSGFNIIYYNKDI